MVKHQTGSIHVTGEIEEVRRIRDDVEETRKIKGNVKVLNYSEREGFHAQGLYMYPNERLIRSNGRRAYVSSVDYTILKKLADADGEVVPKEEFMRELFGDNYLHYSQTYLRFYMTRGRKILTKLGGHWQIEAVPRVGYRLTIVDADHLSH